MFFNASIGSAASYAAKSNWLEARRLEGVINKMKFGRRLSYDEKAFLKLQEPELYEKAIKIEEERAEFRRELSNCKTKQEVLQARSARATNLRTEARNNGDAKSMTMRLMAMLDEFSDFAKGLGS